MLGAELDRSRRIVEERWLKVNDDSSGGMTLHELAAEYGVHPTMIHQWKKALLDGAADIFERGGRKPVAEVDEETVRSLHAKIGELAIANDFLSRKLKPWTGK